MTLPKFRIVRVDLDGFNGREHHPTADHVGLTVRAYAMRSFYADGDALDNVDDITDEDAHHEAPERLDDAIALWSCVTDDGDLLDLLSFEVEPATDTAVAGQQYADALRACTGAVSVTVNDGDRSGVSRARCAVVERDRSEGRAVVRACTRYAHDATVPHAFGSWCIADDEGGR